MLPQVGYILRHPNCDWEIISVEGGLIRQATCVGTKKEWWYIGESRFFKPDEEGSDIEQWIRNGYTVDSTTMFNRLIDEYYGL